MKKFKWTLGLVFCLALVLSLVPCTAFAAESGTCGDNLIWELDEEGTLTISGTGDMYDYSNRPEESPWQSWRYKIKQINIEEGVTSISSWAFAACNKMSSVTIGKSVKNIGHDAFADCSGLTDIIIPASVESCGKGIFSGCFGLTDVTFWGDAPGLGDYMFEGVTATVHYPCSDETWTDDVRKPYGGNLTWEASHAKGVFPGKEPTCTETGLTDGEICLTCHELVEKGEVIPAKGHKGVYRDNEAEATCCTEGVKRGGAECKVCGEELIEDTILPIDPNNHKNIVTDKSVKATSTKTGLTAGSHCADCGKVIKKQTLTLAKPVLTSGTKNIARKKIVVKWKKNSTCTGYQVKYVTGSTTKTVKVTSKSTLSKTLKKLKKGKTYKVYVRCYKTIDGKTYYSAYSTAKSVKVKK
ncbi:MAG: leucine-rich repeat domain-containing protein [Clostridiales bacterium]|nr:leucine-rich repeat domain-containing protein [Candidatus Crickella caballi]